VVQNGRCTLTNNSWMIDAAELLAAYKFSTVRLINDFEAVAWSLPVLSRDKLLQIGGRQPVVGPPLAALGPGTGLGMAVNIPHATSRFVLSSEGGHSTMAGSSPREDAVIAYLRQRFGHVSAERVLSGSGLETLYEAIAVPDGIALPKRRAAEITQQGIKGACATSRAAIEMFCGMLGTVAGNLALTLGAKGGYLLPEAFCVTCPNILSARNFVRVLKEKGGFANISSRFRSTLFWTKM